MMDRLGPVTQREEVADAAERESRHAVLRELLAGYADGELPPETRAQIDAHLVGCVACRRELSVQGTLNARLALEAPLAASPALRARIGTALDETPRMPATAGSTPRAAVAPRTSSPLFAPLAWPVSRALWLAAAGWLVAGALALTLLLRAQPHDAAGVQARTSLVSRRAVDVPLLDSVFTSAARVGAGELPGRARDLSAVRAALPFPVQPLASPDARLISAWTTSLAGEPAAVLAYRVGDRVVVQYIIAEDAFFRSPAIRSAVAGQHALVATRGAQTLVAWPRAETGSVLVGELSGQALARLIGGERAH